MLGTGSQWVEGGKSDDALTGRQHTGKQPARGARLLPGAQAAPTHMARGWLVAGRRIADDGGSLPNCRGLFHRWDIRSWSEPYLGGRGHAHCSVSGGVGHHVPNRRRDVLTGEERSAGPYNLGDDVQLPAARYSHPGEHRSWRGRILARSRPCPGCHIHAAARFDFPGGGNGDRANQGRGGCLGDHHYGRRRACRPRDRDGSCLRQPEPEPHGGCLPAAARSPP